MHGANLFYTVLRSYVVIQDNLCGVNTLQRFSSLYTYVTAYHLNSFSPIPYISDYIGVVGWGW